MEKTWKVVLAFVVIFMAGAGTGSLVALRFAKAFMPQPRQPREVVEQFGIMQMQRLAGRLDLTDAQKEKIRPIVQKSGEDIWKLSRDSQVATRDIITRMNEQVSALLTPEQVKKFGEIQRRMNQEFLNRGYRGSGGPMPMGKRPPGPQGQGGGFRQPRSSAPGAVAPQPQTAPPAEETK